jgi:hypothetical protein
VPAEFVERLDADNLGRVKESTGAWIGTSVEHVSEHQQQVTLKAGELVQVVGEKLVGAKSGKEQAWLKITPPAGEYRWVHLRDVSRQKPEEPVAPVTAEVEAVSEPETTTPALSQKEREGTREPRRLELPGNAIALRDIEEPASGGLRLDRYVEPAQYRTMTSGSESRPISPDGFVPRRRREGESPSAASPAPIRTTTTPAANRPRLDPDARIATATPRPSQSIGSSSTLGSGGLGGDEIARQLDQIEIDLSLMVAQERSQWNLPALRRRVETLVEGGADPTSRGRARLVLDKIKQFEDAFERNARIVGSGGHASTGGQAASGAQDKAPSVSSSLADPRYDAEERQANRSLRRGRCGGTADLFRVPRARTEPAPL